jgi:DNA-3-methyladenine glycosylase I
MRASRHNARMSARPGLFKAEDGALRCSWCQATPAYQHYHDHEWGFPVTDDRRLFESSASRAFRRA